MLEWHWKTFSELGTRELYAILKVRQEVFAVEQDCAYLDLDDLDQHAWHLFSLTDSNEIEAYLRLLKPGLKYREPSIGRVLTSAESRGRGLGRSLMREGLKRTAMEFPAMAVRISAQQYLQKFYASLGFVPVGDPYLEDGIHHIEMYLAAERSKRI